MHVSKCLHLKLQLTPKNMQQINEYPSKWQTASSFKFSQNFPTVDPQQWGIHLPLVMQYFLSFKTVLTSYNQEAVWSALYVQIKRNCLLCQQKYITPSWNIYSLIGLHFSPSEAKAYWLCRSIYIQLLLNINGTILVDFSRSWINDHITGVIIH